MKKEKLNNKFVDNLKFGERFFYIHSTGFMRKIKDCNSCIRPEETRWQSYYEIRPVYVHSKDINWKGEKGFDICPINFSIKKNEKKSWSWRMGIHQDNSFIQDLFKTKKACIKYARTRFGEKWETYHLALKKEDEQQQKDRKIKP